MEILGDNAAERGFKERPPEGKIATSHPLGKKNDAVGKGRER